MRVGIVDVATYTPSGIQTADEIAALSGIPADVIRERFGLESKRIAGPDEHVSVLAARAAESLLQRAGGRVDVLIYMGSPHRDYPVWSAAPKVQQLLGNQVAGSLAFDIQGVSAGAPIALAVAKGLIVSDPSIRRVLLVGASREHDLIDYTNHRSRFMFTFGAGGAAALVARDHGANEILATAGYTDGSFADDVMVPAGGSREPASEESVRSGRHFLDVRDPIGMKARLDPISADRFVRVARDAVERSGRRIDQVALLCMLHTKRSLFQAVVSTLGLPLERAIYLSDRGHMSAIDPFVALARARDVGLLRPGDLVLLLSAGTGYSWTATAIQWGPS